MTKVQYICHWYCPMVIYLALGIIGEWSILSSGYEGLLFIFRVSIVLLQPKMWKNKAVIGPEWCTQCTDPFHLHHLLVFSQILQGLHVITGLKCNWHSSCALFFQMPDAIVKLCCCGCGGLLRNQCTARTTWLHLELKPCLSPLHQNREASAGQYHFWILS